MKQLFTFALVLFSINMFSQGPDYLWAKDIGRGNVYGRSMVFDSDGNIYTAGEFSGANDFDPGPDTLALSAPGSAFISKLDASGNLIWAKQLEGISGQNITSICVDFNQNVYVTGWFAVSADFDPGPGSYIINIGMFSSCCYVLKLDVNGNFVWAQSLGGYSSGYGITCDLSGSNIYLTGQFSDTIRFNNGMSGTDMLVASSSTVDCFIAQLDAQGNSMWSKQIGGVYNDFGYAICLDNWGNVLVTGNFIDTVDFDPGAGITNMISGLNLNGFVLKLTPSGNFVWAKNIGDASNSCEHPSSISSANGDVFITGNFETVTDFDPGPAVYNLSCPYHDVFILKLDANGDFVWARQFGDNSNAQNIGRFISTDGSGNSYITGSFQGTADMDPGPGIYNLTSLGDYDAFISKLDANGDFVWAKQLGGSAFQEGFAVLPDQYGDIYTMGYFQTTVDFNTGAGIYNLTGSHDMFLHKMGVCTAPSPPSLVTGNLNICKGDSLVLVVSGLGQLSWYDSIADSLAIQYGDSLVMVYDSTTTLYVQDSTCKNSLTRTAVTVVVNVPEVLISGADTICYGQTIALTATGAQNYLWNTGGILATEQVAPLTNTMYTVTGIDVYSCTDTASKTVCVRPAFDITTTVNGTILSANNPNASYQWVDCNDMGWVIVSDTNQTYTPPANGSYAVIIQSGICVDTSACITVSSIGLKKENQNVVMQVYPNPGSGQFVISVSDVCHISIISEVGVTIWEQEIKVGNNSLDLREFPDGIYLLKLNGKSGQQVTRLVKINE